MKKILFITDIGSPWGGSEELWSKSAYLLNEKGYSVHASVGWHGSIHQKVQNLIDAGIKVHFRKSILRKLCEKASQYLANPLLKKIKPETNRHIDKINPDLLVFSQSHIFSAWKNMLFAYEKRIKYCVVTQLNSELSAANDSNYKLIQQAFKNAEKCFFVSKGNLELLETQLAFNLPNAQVISNPFNMDKVDVLPWVKKDVLNFAYVGRLDFTHKGIDILLRAFANEKWKARDFFLNIYGAGNIKLAQDLAKHLNLENKIIFHGHVNNIKDIWKENHILALASRYEGMPLVLIEAMFCQRTAIVTDVAGHSELIEDGVNGFVVPAAHYKLFAKKLEDVWQNRNNLKEYGQKAYASITQKVDELPEKKLTDLIIMLNNN
jgi:glycosyltransferase involved in cell wall biosynthesis